MSFHCTPSQTAYIFFGHVLWESSLGRQCCLHRGASFWNQEKKPSLCTRVPKFPWQAENAACIPELPPVADREALSPMCFWSRVHVQVNIIAQVLVKFYTQVPARTKAWTCTYAYVCAWAKLYSSSHFSSCTYPGGAPVPGTDYVTDPGLLHLLIWFLSQTQGELQFLI